MLVLKISFSELDIRIEILPANSWIICLHAPHGVAPSFVTTAMDLKSLWPSDRAEKIATLSAHKVVGYAFDSILNPIIISSLSVNKAAPTG